MSAETEVPPLIGSEGKPAAATRVMIGLVLFGLLDLIHGITMIASAFKAGGPFQINLSPTFIPAWAAAALIWFDKRPIWPILAYGSALMLGGLIGSVLGCALGLPPKLISAFAHGEPFTFSSNLGYFLLLGVFLAWLLLEAEGTRPTWREAAGRPTAKWLRPKVCWAYPIVPTLLISWGALSLLQGSWTEPVIQRARAEHGDDYDYFVTNYRFESRNGRASYSAAVLAYNEKELNEIQLQWTNDPKPNSSLAH